MIFKETSVSLSDLHFEHTQWTKELAFWKDELNTFQHRLGEVISKWTDNGVLAQTEHFQNQFIRHHEVVDQLVHDIREHEHALAKLAERQPDTIEFHRFKDHKEIRGRMNTQRKIYHELKKEFFDFLTEAM